MIKVELESGGGRRTIELGEEVISLGRTPDNTLPIPDEKASRKHATILKLPGGYVVRDESRNGMLLNGKKLAGDILLSPGDLIKIGDTQIRVVETGAPVPAPSPPPAPPPPLDPAPDFKAREQKRGMLTRVVAIGLCVIAGYVLFTTVKQQLDRKGPPGLPQASEEPNELREAEAALERLRSRALSAPTVSDALLEDVREAGAEFNPGYPEDVRTAGTPFDGLLGQLMQRRSAEAATRLDDADGRIEEALREGRYAEAMNVVKALQSNSDPLFKSATVELVERVQASIRKDFEAVDSFGKRLEERKLFLDAQAHYSDHAPRFKGTVHFAYLNNKPEILESLAAAEATARAPKPEPEPEPAAPKPAPTAEKPKPAASPLLLKLVAAIKTGKIPGKNYATETHYRSEGKEHPWSEVEPAEMLTLYEALAFKDDDLRQLAEWAWTSGLRENAPRLLARYLAGGRTDRKETVDGIVAKWRGVGVPKGGYAYMSKHGWEDAADRLNREAAERTPDLVKRLASARDAKQIKKYYEELVRYHDADGMQPDRVHEIREQAVAALVANKQKRLEAIEAKAKKSVGFAQLKKLKIELNRRRAAALKLIYDEQIYLREDHPDWRKGDEINGQIEVDKLVLQKHVGSVEELWKGAGQMAASLDPSIQREVDLLNTINGTYLPGLGEKPDAEALAAYEQVMLNLNARVSLKSIVLNAEEAEIYSWNRRVEKFNAELRDPNIGSDEKAHAKVVNDYREMMGRKRLFLDGRLCVATKKHSEAQNAAQRIWHVGPNGDPQSRARAEGFPAGVGENVAIGYGTPDEVWWRGWYRASDHHRNALSKGWTCMGYGYVGNVGSQNFSKTPPPSGFPAK